MGGPRLGRSIIVREDGAVLNLNGTYDEQAVWTADGRFVVLMKWEAEGPGFHSTLRLEVVDVETASHAVLPRLRLSLPKRGPNLQIRSVASGIVSLSEWLEPISREVPFDIGTFTPLPSGFVREGP